METTGFNCPCDANRDASANINMVQFWDGKNAMPEIIDAFATILEVGAAKVADFGQRFRNKGLPWARTCRVPSKSLIAGSTSV